MIGWLWRLLVGRLGCEHQWKVLERVRCVSDAGETFAFDYELQCQLCGNIKGKRV